MRYSCLTAALLVLGLLPGCATTVQGLPPTTSVPVQWEYPTTSRVSLTTLDLWQDPELRAVVVAALSNNATLHQLAAKLRMAEASSSGTAASQLPAFELVANPGISRNGATPNGNITGRVSWELDLFGKLDALLRSDKLAAEAQVHLLEDARISLATEVAQTYVKAQAAASLSSSASRSLESAEIMLRIAKARQAAGTATRVDVLGFESRVADATSNVVAARQRSRMLAIQLAYLTGLPLGADPPNATGLVTFDTPSLDRVPAAVILSRPDVRSADNTMRAAAAYAEAIQLGIKYPVLNLGGMISAGLFGAAPAWTLTSTIAAPLLRDRGTAAVAVVIAQADAATAAYQKTVSSAVADVESALVNLGQADTVMSLAAQSLGRQNQIFTQVTASFTAGATSLFQVEEARQQLIARENQAIVSRQDQVLAVLGLYRAAGGVPLPDVKQQLPDPAANAAAALSAGVQHER